MKQMKIWSVLFAFIVAANTLDAETKRYGIQSGIIEYIISGGGNMMGIQTQIDGKSKTLFKEWGAVELHEETSKSVIMGREEVTHQTTKIDHGKVYIVDYEQKIIHQYDHTMLIQSEYKEFAKSAKEVILSMNGSKTGEETILGYICEIWEAKHMKLWLHKGIMLKSKVRIMGRTHTTEATNIQFNISVSDEDLKLPDFPIQVRQDNKDNTPSQMPQMTPEQIQQMQEMMKNFTQK
ncbi:hypothetical protein TSL6_02820 [Sulfurovum sp. TSL6]|uniref:DUF4412 domain-containing protein n=1 Tax=Sulfurovum sp. TSL6 TaxID=2826995 RepID=UPI001CC66613|nr:DUF4412 domain-containing protein [Sulfurovum sp. TSL6]GIT99775.1 hypothetical protein TSL6_02820 [Sulfurovum sp. TSL6]